MKKVKIILNINDYKLDTFGYLNNNIISFKDKDLEKTEIIYDISNDVLIRDNSEMCIKMFFNKDMDNMEYNLKNYNLSFKSSFSKYKLLKDESHIIISYQVGDNLFNLSIYYEEVR